MADRRLARDRGFTLPEVLITLVVVGLLAGSVATAFTVIVRSMPPAEARADDARSLTGLTTYLPEDVGSTPPDAFVVDDPEHLTGCAGPSPGLGLLHLAWSNGTRAWNVDYRLEPDDDYTRVRRYECEPGGTPTVSTLTSRLPWVDPAIWRPGWAPVAITSIWDASGRVVGVRVTVTTESGLTASMVARSNNPAETLSEITTTTTPVVTTSTTTTTTTTTTSTTTTVAPTTTDLSTATGAEDESTTTTTTAAISTTTTTTTTSTTTTTTTLPPCEVTSAVADPLDPTNDRGKSAKTMATLADHVHVEVQTTGVCPDLVLEFDPDLSDGTYDPQWLSFETSGAAGIATIEAQPAGVPWSDGTHVLTVRNGIGTATLAEIALEVS